MTGTLGAGSGGGVDGGRAGGGMAAFPGGVGGMGTDRMGANEMDDADGNFGAEMAPPLGGGTDGGAT